MRTEGFDTVAGWAGATAAIFESGIYQFSFDKTQSGTMTVPKRFV
jgi:hypothetical protein